MDVSAQIRKYKVVDGKGFKLKDFDPADCGGLKSKEQAQSLLDEGVKRLSSLQERLYAQDKWALLVVLQAMDAAGKDGAVKHVMTGVNPQGCQVHSFKAPSAEELDHDYLWRAHKAAPERGRIGIFNRSHYEDVLVVKVHPEILRAGKLPEACLGKNVWDNRYEDIRNFETYLSRNGYVVQKFFLHVSKAEQKKRLLERLEESDKNWKFEERDIVERESWDAYMDAYETAIRRTATPEAPWYVLPADNKWYTRLLLASAMVEALEKLDLKFPDVDPRKKAELKAMEKKLRAQKD
jgi:PPK2 family polyphosphate:nucleotide phosphotransferase